MADLPKAGDLVSLGASLVTVLLNMVKGGGFMNIVRGGSTKKTLKVGTFRKVGDICLSNKKEHCLVSFSLSYLFSAIYPQLSS